VHVTAVGADAPHKRELHQGVLTRANRIAVDDLTQAHQLGELKQFSAEALTALPIVSLGAVLAGDVAARTSDTDITVADLTGLGVQDTALANIVAHRLDTFGHQV
jgi:ornithine cyclodeaminase